MKTAVLCVGLIVASAIVGSGQVLTITNSTLERFQQKRLAGEREYKENYERLGFPSPEELNRQRDEDMNARIVLADQLRTARLEQQRIDLDSRRVDLDERRVNIEAARADSEIALNEYNSSYNNSYGNYGGYTYGNGYGYRYGGGYNRFGFGYGRFGRFGTGYWGYPSNRLEPLYNGGASRSTPVGTYRGLGVQSPRFYFGTGIR